MPPSSSELPSSSAVSCLLFVEACAMSDLLAPSSCPTLGAYLRSAEWKGVAPKHASTRWEAGEGVEEDFCKASRHLRGNKHDNS